MSCRIPQEGEQEPKILLKPCKNQSQRTTTRSRQILRFAEACAEASDERPKLSAPPRPSRRGPAPQSLGWDTNSPIRLRLGSATTSSPPSRPTPLTKRHVQLMRPTTPSTSAARWRSTGRVTDGTGDQRSRGYLPLCPSLCPLLTPVLPCAT